METCRKAPERREALRAEAAEPRSENMAEVILKNIKKVYPNSEPKKKSKDSGEKKHNLQITDEGVVAVQEFNLDIADREFIVLVGPSGCGKSTTLRMVAGLEEISAGELYIDGKLMNDVAPKDRDIAMVFQNYALYPHMTVYENMAFSLKLKKVSKDEIDRKVREAAEILDITQYLDRRPKALSGGQRQRVAIGRAIVREPKVLLMDEPLSNLDAKLRLEMRYELQRLHVETGSTFVYVTHDQMEAMTLATKICLINNGVLQQYDAPLDVYNRPANLFVADFVGNPSINFVEAKGKEQADGSFRFTILDDLEATFRPNEPIDMDAWFRKRDQDAADLEAQRLEMLKDKKAVEKSNKDEVFKYHIAKVDESDYAVEEEPEITNEDFVLAIRPEALKLSKDGSVASTIYGAMPTGMESTVKLKIGKYLLTGVIFGGVTFKLGEETGVDIAGTDILLFDRKSGKAIAAGSLSVKG